MTIKFKISTGEIICAGSFNGLVPSADETVIQSDFVFEKPITHYKIKDGQIIEKTLEEINKYLYAQKRREEYPPITDQLDAIWKGGADLDAMRAQVLSVKAKYPKPV